MEVRCWLGVLALFIGTGAGAEENQVNVYNWSDYISPHTIPDFEKATGIKVVYDTFDADATVEAKVMTGGATYDVVSTQTIYFGRQIKAGVYLELDKSKLPNWKNLDPKILAAEARFDPGNAHAMPYMHGTNGFAYDIDAIKKRMPDAPLDSLDMLFKPEIVAKFQDCGVTFLDSPMDVIQFALTYLHLDPNSHKPEDFRAAEKLLLSVRPYLKGFDSTELINGLANREVCLVMTWSGDYAIAAARAKAAHVDIHLGYTVPKEGANAWYDAFLIPKAAPHPEAAYKFLNFILDPKVIADISNEIHYANDNLASKQYVDPVLLNDPAIYPTPEMEQRLYLALLDPSAETERLRTRVWTRVKTGL
jgi:putrescine transport system substrate-binding protein